MKWMLPVLLITGCSTATAIVLKEKNGTHPFKQRYYKPSELVYAKVLPDGFIRVYGRVICWDREVQTNGKLNLTLANTRNFQTESDESITIIFEPDVSGKIAEEVMLWFDMLQVDKSVSLIGKVMKQKEVDGAYLVCNEIEY